jgi:dihydropteroate synthase
MIREGVDIIDVGGESTRPGFTPVSEEEELERVLPAIRLIKKETDIPVSVDTTKAVVAGEAIREGADLINDVSGLGADPEMGRVVAESGLPCILMHDRGEICGSDRTEEYLPLLIAEMSDIAAKAVKAGIRRDMIILDPGIGFNKTWEQNMMILANVGRLRKTGFPILLGASRKSVIGKALELSGTERDEATAALSVIAANEGVSFVRVHDIVSNKRAVMMTEALYPFRL